MTKHAKQDGVEIGLLVVDPKKRDKTKQQTLFTIGPELKYVQVGSFTGQTKSITPRIYRQVKN